MCLILKPLLFLHCLHKCIYNKIYLVLPLENRKKNILCFLHNYLCVHVLNCVVLFATPWTVAHQAPPVHGIFQARMLEWVTIPYTRESSQPRD